VWYCEDCGEIVVAEKADLPVDPLSDDPPVDACPECGHDEFEPEETTCSTRGGHLQPDPAHQRRLGLGRGRRGVHHGTPRNCTDSTRPQGHDIISFWLFHTLVKCYEHTGEVPFEETMINGHVLDENREKMSKSVGNVVEPEAVLAEFPVDATRYWAARTAVGDDFPFKEKDLRAGEKLIRKLWNASKLVESLAPEPYPDTPADEDLRELDRWLLAELSTTESSDSLGSSRIARSRRPATNSGASSGTRSVTTTSRSSNSARTTPRRTRSGRHTGGS